ncbi:hypothetical protein HKCCE3408_17735 [Rhodobacterales bacterium HKCCE3408]|nr:hypothetical protein [Rhodobacterales bacterium HKCCE3408]
MCFADIDHKTLMRETEERLARHAARRRVEWHLLPALRRLVSRIARRPARQSTVTVPAE